MQQPKPDRWKILETASLVDEATWREHFAGFVNNFVEENRRERWMHLLLNRPKQIYSNSHKLHGHLDWSKCSRLENENQVSLVSIGVYYGFTDMPVVLTVADAFVVGAERDGIFSIVPGKLAIYFFHENENVLCQIKPGLWHLHKEQRTYSGSRESRTNSGVEGADCCG